MKNKKGLTLIELIIVLAVIAIIGAILIPNYLTTTDKARLKSDIQSARVIQNALELYNAEQSKPMGNKTITEIISELSLKGYIDSKQANTQTSGASWAIDSQVGVVVDISGANVDEKIKTTVFNQLSDQEKPYVTGGKNAGVTP